MQQMRPERSRQAEKQDEKPSMPQFSFEPGEFKRASRILGPELELADLKERLLHQLGQSTLTQEQVTALKVLVSVDRRHRKLGKTSGFSVEMHACYSIINRLGRPSLRCDQKDVPMAKVVERFPMDALGWTMPSLAIESALESIVGSVGRIEPKKGSHESYFGTGFLLSTDDNYRGKVMTNWHVIRAMQEASLGWAESNDKIYFTSEYYVDFDGSEKTDRDARARVICARQNPTSEMDARRLDIGILEIDLPATKSSANANDLVLRRAPAKFDYLAEPTTPTDTPVLVVGYPLRAMLIGKHNGIDWTQLVAELFGTDFGFKRVSPGLIKKSQWASDPASDPCQWTIGHDASTLKGSSGSPVIAADGSGVFAIHFSGADLDVNHAHSLHRARTITNQMLAAPMDEPA